MSLISQPVQLGDLTVHLGWEPESETLFVGLPGKSMISLESMGENTVPEIYDVGTPEAKFHVW